MLVVAFTVLLIFINLAGLGLLCRRWLPDYALAKVAGIIAFCLGLFFVEHYVGLGRLHWVWPLVTLVSLRTLYVNRDALASIGFWTPEKVFGLAFAYGFGWRYFNPDIYPSSEHVTDLFFISNYLGGTRLPPVDRWDPTQNFDYYYSFQHYAASLMARIFGLDGGSAYNYAFGIITALTVLAAWVFARAYCEKRWQRWLVIAALVVGGTGVSPAIHLLHHDEGHDQASRQHDIDASMWASMRFAGNYDQTLNTPLAEKLFRSENDAYPPQYAAQDLPIETFSYLYFVGDYHPPSGGFLLLMLGLGLIAFLHRQPNHRLAHMLLGATPVIAFVTNAWISPMQFGLVASWAAYRVWSKEKPDWIGLALGFGIATGLLYPFLQHFTANARDLPMHLVRPMDHTPLRRFLLQQWPLLLLIGLGLAEGRTRKLAVMFGLGFLGMLLFSECVSMSDSPVAKFARTNSTMKWGSWVYVGGTFALGTLALASRRRWVQVGAVLALLLPLAYVYDIGRFWLHTPMPDRGVLSGHAWLSADATNEEMLDYLREAPDGIVLESQDAFAYTQTTAFALFSDKTAMLGWPAHLTTWHEHLNYVDALYNQTKVFYSGGLDDPTDWLLGNKVRYVVWRVADEQRTAGARVVLTQRMQGKYDWHPFGPLEGGAGIWVRRDPDWRTKRSVDD